jgi:hypothetical protein
LIAARVPAPDARSCSLAFIYLPLMRSTCLVIAALAFPSSAVRSAEPKPVDLTVYVGMAGGIISAVAAARQGATVVVLEPAQHVGGIVTGGLGFTDSGIKPTIRVHVRRLLPSGSRSL